MRPGHNCVRWEVIRADYDWDDAAVITATDASLAAEQFGHNQACQGDHLPDEVWVRLEGDDTPILRFALDSYWSVSASELTDEDEDEDEN